MSIKSITLDGVVNIAKADALHHELEEIIKVASPAAIKAETVQRVDTAVLQLLSSFIISMSELELSVTWDGVSEELQVAAKLLGLEEALNLQTVK